MLPYGEWETTEVEWATDPKTIQWTAQLHDAVIFGDTACPLCNGKQVVDVVQRLSTTGEYRTSASQCRCQPLIRFKADRDDRHGHLYTLHTIASTSAAVSLLR